jgi:hypothetical protein
MNPITDATILNWQGAHECAKTRQSAKARQLDEYGKLDS